MAAHQKGKKVNVNFTALAEPAFLQKLRAKHGLKSKEDDHRERLDAKRAKPTMPSNFDDIPVNEDEQPQVVVLKKSHLSQEQAEALIRQGAGGAEGVLAAANAESSEGDEAGLNKPPSDEAKAQPSQKQKITTAVGAKRSKPKVKGGLKAKSLGKKNSNTLSFGDDDDE
eukprot:m.182339 g.182339  ORF g.182339 m.182339 type:complete len:169 (+) comp16884_c1_seq6:1169-1675(+)